MQSKVNRAFSVDEMKQWKCDNVFPKKKESKIVSYSGISVRKKVKRPRFFFQNRKLSLKSIFFEGCLKRT